MVSPNNLSVTSQTTKLKGQDCSKFRFSPHLPTTLPSCPSLQERKNHHQNKIPNPLISGLQSRSQVSYQSINIHCYRHISQAPHQDHAQPPSISYPAFRFDRIHKITSSLPSFPRSQPSLPLAYSLQTTDEFPEIVTSVSLESTSRLPFHPPSLPPSFIPLVLILSRSQCATHLPTPLSIIPQPTLSLPPTRIYPRTPPAYSSASKRSCAQTASGNQRE